MKTKWLLLAVFTVALLAVALVYFYFPGRLSFLILNPRATLEVNGMLVQGEILRGRTSALVTTRGAGKNHSYRLFFEGDTDSTGDMGSVVDCAPWVAPHLPFLLETANYPPCKNLLGDASYAGRWPLVDKGKFMLFVLPEKSTISIRR
jgi:hypothetical protein